MRITRLTAGLAAMLTAGATLPGSLLGQTPPFDDRSESVVWLSTGGQFDALPPTSRRQQAVVFSATAASAWSQREQPGVGWTVLGATAGSLLGAAAGVGVGALVTEPGEANPGPYVGAIIGFTAGAPIGAHLGNGRRGNIWYSALGSAIVAPAAMWIGSRAFDTPGIMVALPLVQIGTATVIERVTSR